MENGITISRVFNSPVQSLWEAWTKPELVKKWWGPKDFWSPSVKIDFRVGGKYIYSMHGPKGSPWDRDLYSAGIYQEIVPMERLVVTDYFSDEEGNKASPTEHGLDPNMPQEMTVTVRFEDLGDSRSKVSIEYPKPENKEQLEAMKKSKMEEGWGTSLDKLAQVIE